MHKWKYLHIMQVVLNVDYLLSQVWSSFFSSDLFSPLLSTKKEVHFYRNYEEIGNFKT